MSRITDAFKALRNALKPPKKLSTRTFKVDVHNHFSPTVSLLANRCDDKYWIVRKIEFQGYFLDPEQMTLSTKIDTENYQPINLKGFYEVENPNLFNSNLHTLSELSVLFRQFEKEMLLRSPATRNIVGVTPDNYYKKYIPS